MQHQIIVATSTKLAYMLPPGIHSGTHHTQQLKANFLPIKLVEIEF